MKSERQKAIIQIIENNVISTQENLQKELEKRGYKVTQATLSRDIRELNLHKTVDSSGRYKYTPAKENETAENLKNDNFLDSNGIISADYALNTVVVKCHTGYAQGVCARLDNAGIENSLGTIAGDDTIFILMRSEKAAENLVRTLESRFNLNMGKSGKKVKAEEE